ncbi:dsrm domain-containing protein [Rhizoctonia solani AG-1 IA]|uniref:Dsrm domain-containing protein n=1 Tax=Thanatephorus cucumeris (strain AG1-IA) TaxID=983506 RepID=L8WLN9_THACA|nr:dsrm domain-containing protein [Rhizoctonia solani AG-1 IA]
MCTLTSVRHIDTYRLESWAATEYRGEGMSKREAQQAAAERLLRGENYCVSRVSTCFQRPPCTMPCGYISVWLNDPNEFVDRQPANVTLSQTFVPYAKADQSRESIIGIPSHSAIVHCTSKCGAYGLAPISRVSDVTGSAIDAELTQRWPRAVVHWSRASCSMARFRRCIWIRSELDIYHEILNLDTMFGLNLQMASTGLEGVLYIRKSAAELKMSLIPFTPVTTIRWQPPPRYEPYRKRQEPTWLDALHTWRDRTGSTITWAEELRRDENNKMHLRRAAGSPIDAFEESKSAVESNLGRHGKALVAFYSEIQNGGKGPHCRYNTFNISYSYRLDNWPVEECRGEGSKKAEAKQKAAKLLLEKGTYCVSIGPPFDCLTGAYMCILKMFSRDLHIKR